MNIRRLLGSLMLLLGMAGTASAGIIVSTGPDNTGTDNVIDNGCNGSPIQGPALTIQGCLNTDHDEFVNFTSNENLVWAGGGQATIDAQDGEFTTLAISLADGTSTFNKIVLNIDITAPTGFVTFTGVPGGSVGPYALNNGSNFFTITGDPSFSSLSFVTTVGANLGVVADVKQVRLGVDDGDDVTVVPEPASLLLLGTGLFGVAARARARRKLRTQQ